MSSQMITQSTQPMAPIIGWKKEQIAKNAASRNFHGNGKLLLTGEYLVLEGAKALAIPTRVGQSLKVQYRKSDFPKLYWKSYDSNSTLWFECEMELWHFNIINSSLYHQDTYLSETSLLLQMILKEARRLNPHFLREAEDVFVETSLEFPLDWGLGSSSTLIYNIAQWAYVGPFQLAQKSFGGSGYDIACAQSQGPIIYCLQGAKSRNQSPTWKSVEFNPPFGENLYLVYLEKKQNTLEARRYYSSMEKDPQLIQKAVQTVDSITDLITKTNNLVDFNSLINLHESVLSEVLKMPTVKSVYFQDFWGEIKSLGAWGGDFILVTSDRSEKQTTDYFTSKGFPSIVSYNSMIKNESTLLH